MTDLILLVEDEPELMKISKETLERYFPNKTIICASSGLKAKSILEDNNDFALIVTDHNMPGCTGKELIQFCLKKEIETPIVVYHGGSVPNEIFFEAGGNCVAVVDKPNLDELSKVVLHTFKK